MAFLLVRELWGFLRDSTPGRKRSRYGDMDYDWEQRVDTTAGSVGWRERLLGLFHSPYQPTDPTEFREMMNALPIDFREFTFVDIGSGKGRTLLMASTYPFRKIVGVEVLPELNRIAQENIRAYRNPTQRCPLIEANCADACDFELPEGPLVLYLFNPLPETALREFVSHLGALALSPYPLWLIYHNPLLEAVVDSSSVLMKVRATAHYALYRSRGNG